MTLVINIVSDINGLLFLKCFVLLDGFPFQTVTLHFKEFCLEHGHGYLEFYNVYIR